LLLVTHVNWSPSLPGACPSVPPSLGLFARIIFALLGGEAPLDRSTDQVPFRSMGKFNRTLDK